MKTLGIIGSGHLGQQIAHYAISDKHFDRVVFFDDFTADTMRNGHPILGTTATIEASYKNAQFDEIIIGIGYNHLPIRKEMYQKYAGSIPFATIIHSTVWKDPTAQVAAGCVIYPTCCLDAEVVIAENTILNVGCTIAHDTQIHAHCFLSPRVCIAGFVTVGETCIIGINTTIIDNITITPQTRLGGGTVVVKNIEKSGLYVGNPQRFIR